MADIIAVSAISAIWNSGLSVPTDTSVLGYDDIEEAATTFPALTTIRQPIKVIAERAFKLLMDLMKEEVHDEVELPFILQPELIVRHSCSSPISQS